MLERFPTAHQLHEPVLSFQFVFLSPVMAVGRVPDDLLDPDRLPCALYLKASGFSPFVRSAFPAYLDLLLLYQNRVIFRLHIFLFKMNNLYLLFLFFLCFEYRSQ